ncbi:DUF2125 domain-containing protein [Cohaesibacter intestini]|uniref:DUF2125 domain-containing protein n=1 Tax=Cohaesibacter intestini TaxID=2211145 RepID=UPI000DE91729|nr:DUF2125 domain-containing protein [Cohaesibacter intestini]
MSDSLPTETKQPSSKRKYVLLSAFVLLVAVGWSAFWYISYSRTQEIVNRLMARTVDGQQLLQCNEQTLGGYPFRLSLTCASYRIQDPRSGWQAEGGPLRAIWQVYAPNLAVIETENRATLTHQPTGQSFEMVANLMRGSVRFSPSAFVTRASFEATEPTFASNNPQLASLIGDIKAKAMEFHLRPTPDQPANLDVSLAATDFASRALPDLSGQVSFTLVGGLEAVLHNQGNPARAWLEQSGKVNPLAGNIEIGQKTIKLSGDLAFDRLGMANGLIKARILNPPADQANPVQTLTAKKDGLNGPLTALQLMGKPMKDGDLIGSEVEIKLSNGQMKAGFIPLGTVPPLQF